MSSLNVCRQVFRGRPFLLFPPSSTQCMALLAGLIDGSCMRLTNIITHADYVGRRG